MNEKFYILIKISLKFVPNGSIDNNPALVQIMAWCRIGTKPLSEPMLTWFTDTHIYIWYVLGGHELSSSLKPSNSWILINWSLWSTYWLVICLVPSHHLNQKNKTLHHWPFPSVTGGFPSQKASDIENPMSQHHHTIRFSQLFIACIVHIRSVSAKLSYVNSPLIYSGYCVSCCYIHTGYAQWFCAKLSNIQYRKII